MKKNGKALLHFYENVVYLTSLNAPVAQLDRASGYGPEGCRFKSYQVHHLLMIIRESEFEFTFFFFRFFRILSVKQRNAAFGYYGQETI